MAEYERQHDVPQGHLRLFTSNASKTRIWQFDKVSGARQEVGIRDAAVAKHTYSFKNANGSQNIEMEHFLKNIEDRGLGAIKRFKFREELTTEQQWNVARYVAVMVRRPRILVQHFRADAVNFFNEEWHDRWLQQQISEIEDNSTGAEATEAREAIRAGRFAADANAIQKAQIRAWEKTLDKGAAYVLDMEWKVQDAAQSYFFITGDAPAIMRPDSEYYDSVPERWPTSGEYAELIMPISSKRLFIAHHRRRLTTGKASKSRIFEINKLLIRRAHRFVYLKAKTTGFLQLFEENRQFVAPVPDFEGFKEEFRSRMLTASNSPN